MGGAHPKASLDVHAGFWVLHLQNCLNYINFSQINMTQKSTVVKRLSGFLCVGEESVECLSQAPPV